MGKEGIQKSWLISHGDAFLAHVTEKLFALAVVQQLPQLLYRQSLLDLAGCTFGRHRFIRDFRWVPPPLAAVAVAFGIDARARRKLNPERLLLTWQKRHLWRRSRVLELSEDLLPSVQELGEMALASTLRHRRFASLLAEFHS